MVTRSVIRITPAEKASAAKDSNRDGSNNNRLQNKEPDDDKYDTKEDGKKIQFRKAADGGFCGGDGHSHHDVSSHCKPNDCTMDEGKAVDVRRQNNNTAKKRSLLLEDADDNDKKKKRRKKSQKFIDLTGVPPQLPILRSSSGKGGSSQYQGVSFHKAIKKWNAKTKIDGKQHSIGYYDNEEEAAIDYARAVFKYKAGEAEVRGKKFIDLGDVPTPR